VETVSVKAEDGDVYLHRSDGKIDEVPLETLSKQDQEHLAEQAR
jgi:hypothetical protein